MRSILIKLTLLLFCCSLPAASPDENEMACGGIGHEHNVEGNTYILGAFATFEEAWIHKFDLEWQAANLLPQLKEEVADDKCAPCPLPGMCKRFMALNITTDIAIRQSVIVQGWYDIVVKTHGSVTANCTTCFDIFEE